MPRFLGTLLALGALTGISMAATDAAVDAEGSGWQLSSLGGAAPLPDTRVTLAFAEGFVQGSDGCNRYRAPYLLDGDRFELAGRGMSTMMACPPPVMQQAEAFTAALNATRALHLADGRLELLDDDGAVLAVLSRESQALVNTEWRVTGYNNGRQAVVSVLSGTELTLAFGDGGRLSGAAGCNRFQATYEAGDAAIRIGPAATTRRTCAGPDGVMQQEAAFLRALERASSSRIEGGRLELRSADGALQVSGTRVGGAPVPDGAAADTGTGLRLPATFRGDLPCADCEAIRHHLDLWPDRVYHLRREWVGRPARPGRDGHFSVDEIGRWRFDPERSALVLQGGRQVPLQFEVQGPTALRALDRQGRPLDSSLPYGLRSDGALTPAELRLPLRGELRYMADAAVITECLTGRVYPVAFEGDWIATERAYLRAASGPGRPLFVTFDGAIVERPRMEGEGTETTVVVDRFVDAWPSMTCERARADASLGNTYWRIVRLGGLPVTAAPGRREPHMVLRHYAGETSYRATVGCNQMLGAYAQEGDRLHFAPGPTTMTACPPPLDALERALGRALSETAAWQIQGDTLELFDGHGEPVALFEAVYR